MGTINDLLFFKRRFEAAFLRVTQFSQNYSNDYIQISKLLIKINKISRKLIYLWDHECS